MCRVIIDMNNPNTLVSLAYIKTNDNPLLVFCNYTLYCLLKYGDLAEYDLSDKLKDNFGLDMPKAMLKNCINILKREHKIASLSGGRGYTVQEKGRAFDIDEFENARTRLHDQEEKILQSISDFVDKTYNKQWSKDECKNYLSAFLDEEGNGARLFLYDQCNENQKSVSPSWYIAKYVNHILNERDCLEREYLEEIINGMMIYEGIYQTNDYQQNKGQKFKDTVFYLDTKLILRALGYSWQAQVLATHELIDLITKKYEGRIGIFKQTLNEVEGALNRAGKSYNAGKLIVDNELKIYSELDPTGASLFLESSSIVLERLKKEFNIFVAPDLDWDSEENRKYTIEIKEIVDYIKSQRPWKEAAINYDVEIINQINILRKNDYTIRYGGKRKLPIFLTTNTDLVYLFRNYVEQLEGSDWDIHKLPIVSDNMVLFRLWVPFAKEYTNLPALTLSRYAYAAQNPNHQYFEKLKELAIEYGNQQGIDLYNLSEIRRNKLEEILVVKTNGDFDDLTEEMVASSFDELVKMESFSLKSQVDELKVEVENRNSEIEKRNTRIVDLAAENYINKIGLWRIPIFVIKWWWIIIPVVNALIMMKIEASLTKTNNLLEISFFTILPIGIKIIFEIFFRVLDREDLRFFMLKKVIPKAWKSYSNNIISKISEEDMIYKDDILEVCREKTPIFRKYKELCGENIGSGECVKHK